MNFPNFIQGYEHMLVSESSSEYPEEQSLKLQLFFKEARKEYDSEQDFIRQFPKWEEEQFHRRVDWKKVLRKRTLSIKKIAKIPKRRSVRIYNQNLKKRIEIQLQKRK